MTEITDLERNFAEVVRKVVDFSEYVMEHYVADKPIEPGQALDRVNALLVVDGPQGTRMLLSVGEDGRVQGTVI